MRLLVGFLVAAAAMSAPSEAVAAHLPVTPPKPPRITVVYAPCPFTGQAVDGCIEYQAMPTTEGAPVAYVTHRGDRMAREHESGHVYDEELLTDGDRTYFTKAFGFHAGVPWFLTTDEEESPGERFADAYMTCRLGLLPSGGGRVLPGIGGWGWETTSGYLPHSDGRQRQICAAIKRVASR